MKTPTERATEIMSLPEIQECPSLRVPNMAHLAVHRMIVAAIREAEYETSLRWQTAVGRPLEDCEREAEEESKAFQERMRAYESAGKQ